MAPPRAARLDDVDGLQILARVQSRWPDTVTLMLTGYASLDSAVAAMRAGAYDYLCKPCPVDDILATVARGLERRRLAREVKRNVRHLEVSIETARELHSALQSQVEGTRALLHERERLLQSLGAELKTSLLSIAGLDKLACFFVDDRFWNAVNVGRDAGQSDRNGLEQSDRHALDKAWQNEQICDTEKFQNVLSLFSDTF